MVCSLYRAVLLSLLGSVAVLLVTPMATGQVTERAARANATLVVEGTVSRVFSRQVDGQSDYLVKIAVRRAEVTGSAPAGVRFPAPGEPVFVGVSSKERTGLFRRGDSPRVPSEGAEVRVFLAADADGSWQAASADWLETLSARRQTEDTASADRDAKRDKASGEALGMVFDVIETRGKLALRVTNLADNGPASRAGLEIGDVVVGVNDLDIRSVADFQSVVERSAQVMLTVIDINSGRTAQVKVSRSPADGGSANDSIPVAPDRPPVVPDRGPSLGISAERVSVGFRSALKVTSVAPDSPAAKAGLETGDILVKANGTPLTGPEQLVAALKKGKGQLVLTVRDVRTGRDVPVNVDLGQASAPTPTAEPTPSREPVGEPNDLGVVSELAFYDVEAAVKITEVDPRSPAARAGVEVGMLILEANGNRLLHPNDLTEAARTNRQLRLTVVNPNNGRKESLNVDMSDRR